MRRALLGRFKFRLRRSAACSGHVVFVEHYRLGELFTFHVTAPGLQLTIGVTGVPNSATAQIGSDLTHGQLQGCVG